MPVPASINDLSTVPGSNSPPGSESPGLIDDYLRTHASFIATLRDSGKPYGATTVRMSVAAASATATLTADEIVCKSGTSGWILSAFSKTINLSTTGAGGMDTGAAPVSGYVAIYAIYNPTTATSALLAKNATAAAQPETYNGVNMPSGYTASKLVAVCATNASSQFSICLVQDRITSFPTIQVINTTVSQGSPTSLNLSAAVPFNARRVKFRGAIAASSASVAGSITVGGSSNQVGISQAASALPISGSALTVELGYVPLVAAQTAFYTDTVSSGIIAAFILSVTEFEF